MATSESHQVKFNFAALVDNEADDLDAFTENWSKFRLAANFPPSVMMELLLNRIYRAWRRAGS